MPNVYEMHPFIDAFEGYLSITFGNIRGDMYELKEVP